MRLLLLSLLSACPSPPPLAGCSLRCAVEAHCDKTCDPDEEDPTCTEAGQYQAAFAACHLRCEAGAASRGPDCVTAIDAFATCVNEPTCAAGEACPVEGSVYLERCVVQPGDLSCGSTCTGLEIGCLTYEDLGLRGGDDCPETCARAATDSACMEALFTLDACRAAAGGNGYACAIDPGCQPEQSAVVAACDAFAPKPAIAADRAFCAAIAPRQCACGLWLDDDPACAAQAENRCVYALGWGEACRAATTAFDTCMAGLEDCDRDALREACATTWTAWTAACHG
jgi:hypothetical protein